VQYVENVRHYYRLIDRLTGTQILSALAVEMPDRSQDTI
jgi:hypothetical protein